MAVSFRLELFPKSPEDLHRRLLPFITQQQLWRVNLPNKVGLHAAAGGKVWRARPPPLRLLYAPLPLLLIALPVLC